MENPIWGASRRRALELVAAGCPVDYIEAISRRGRQKMQNEPVVICSCIVYVSLKKVT